jgi:hypothetical protein
MQCTVLPHITTSVFINDDESGLYLGLTPLLGKRRLRKYEIIITGPLLQPDHPSRLPVR